MYMAERNIKFRRRVFVHIAAFILSIMIISFLTDGFRISRHSYFTVSYDTHPVHGVIRVEHWESEPVAAGSLNMPPAFFGGFYLAWGMLIVYKISVLARSWWGKTSWKKDPVATEYERLRAVSPEKLAFERKRL